MNYLIDYNFHTHTSRCGHAYGEDEEYVLKAIELGLKVLGFSDHAPFKDIHHEGMRMDYSLLNDYINSINYLKEKYKDKITIYCGLEIEYYEEYDSYYKELLNNGIDYLILGQHGYYIDNKFHSYFYDLDNKENINKYKETVIKAIKTGYFLYVAHPDIYSIGLTDKNYISEIAKDICKVAKEYNTPLEVNLGGIRFTDFNSIINGTEPYPNHYFFKVAKEYNNDIVIGVDAHSPDDFLNINMYFLSNFISRHKLNLLQDLKVKKNG